jgi:membrane protease YdiL (CAAX protease family)
MNERGDFIKAALIIGGITATEGTWVVLNVIHSPARFLRYIGVGRGDVPAIGWLLAAATATLYVLFSWRGLRSVRENLVALSWLKVLTLGMAVASGLCEEAVFRKLLMDALSKHRFAIAMQLAASALLFGAGHGIWGLFRGSLTTAIGATIATGSLGLALAITYVASHRILLPAVVAHTAINLLIEPGLVLAAIRGEMGTSGQNATLRGV